MLLHEFDEIIPVLARTIEQLNGDIPFVGLDQGSLTLCSVLILVGSTLCITSFSSTAYKRHGE